MTKLTFFILPILALIMSCNNKHSFGESFNTTSININLDIKELIKPATKVELTHAVKYKDEFYCFFKEVKNDNSRRDIKFCFVFSETGNGLKKIEVPDDVQNTVYYDLFVKNDKVFLKTYMDSKTFYFDSKRPKWINTKNGEDWFLHFQDKGPYGRVVHLQPMKWKDNWPIIGVDKNNDGTGEPHMVYKKPNVGRTYPIQTP